MENIRLTLACLFAALTWLFLCLDMEIAMAICGIIGMVLIAWPEKKGKEDNL